MLHSCCWDFKPAKDDDAAAEDPFLRWAFLSELLCAAARFEGLRRPEARMDEGGDGEDGERGSLTNGIRQILE